jgi:hypothetical protein
VWVEARSSTGHSGQVTIHIAEPNFFVGILGKGPNFLALSQSDRDQPVACLSRFVRANTESVS